MGTFGNWNGRPEESLWVRTVAKAQAHLDECDGAHENHEWDSRMEKGDREKAKELLASAAAGEVFDGETLLALDMAIGEEGDSEHFGWPASTSLAARLSAGAMLQAIHEKKKLDDAIAKLTDRLKNADTDEADKLSKMAGTDEGILRAAASIASSESSDGPAD